jgi:D-glycero-alpha-D-manno-heptose-7-phosphate kinase
MIISRTPLRLSFTGGGSDLPSYYKKHNGKVVSTSIDKYIYITVNHLSEYFDCKYLLKYSKPEMCDSKGHSTPYYKRSLELSRY